MNKDIKRVEEDKDAEIKRLNNIADKLEQRISSLEKVLESHAKCIGEMRDNKGTKTIDERTIL